jgi:pimeloyl-ACP methyl ester carboxylesterase
MTMMVATRLLRRGTRRITATSTSKSIAISTTPQSLSRGSWLAARLKSTQATNTSSDGGGGTVLHSEWINNNSNNNEDNETANDNHTIVFLHGLLNTGRNVQTMAKKMCAATGRLGLLVDLTGHGTSKGRNDPGVTVTFDTCLADIHATLKAAGIAGTDSDSDDKVTLVGHSLGGRLALQYAHEQYHDCLEHVWLLDTVPGQPHASVVRILQIAEAVLIQPQWPGITGQEVTAMLKDQYGMDQPTAAWLASGFTVNSETGQASFAFDTKVARDLLEGAGRQDLMYTLQQTVYRSSSDHTQNVYNNNHHTSTNNRNTVKVDFVRGLKNTAWEASGHLPTLATLMEQHRDHFCFHAVQAAHNVHSEDLPGLMQAVSRVYKL